MKRKFHYIILLLIVFGAISCKKDNYDAPSSTLKGRLVYNGQAINVQHDRVSFELYQPGFGKVGPISGTFAQDGTYSTLLFNGDYKLIIPNGQGPFRWNENAANSRDTLAVKVSGNQTLDLEVTPYYLINNAQYNVASSTLTSTFSITKVITDANAKDIERVNLYINKTQFVSGNDNIANAEIAGSAITNLNSVSLNATVPNISPTQNYVFVRVGLKVAGVEDLIFSQVQKIQL